MLSRYEASIASQSAIRAASFFQVSALSGLRAYRCVQPFFQPFGLFVLGSVLGACAFSGISIVLRTGPEPPFFRCAGCAAVT